MINVSKFSFLSFNNKKFKCSIGKNGLTNNKMEGDLKTPMGKFKFIKCYYRSDRIKKPQTRLPCKKITKDIGWCDDSNSKYYNKEVKVSKKFSLEKLYRQDHVYDILIVLNYNSKPIIKGKGSAIFFHISKKNYTPTKGCVAVSRKLLLEILKKVKKNSIIKIG